MYSIRTILILLIIGTILLLMSGYFLLSVPDPRIPIRETIPSTVRTDATPSLPTNDLSSSTVEVSRKSIEYFDQNGSDAGMEFPVFEGEIP